MRVYDTTGRDVCRPPLFVDPVGRIFRSRLPNVATAITLVSGTAYFIYVGRATEQIVVKYVEFYVNTAGSGSPQAAEVGLFRTPNAPNKTHQGSGGIVKVAVTGANPTDLDSLTTTGVKRNTNSLDAVVAAGTHLWAGIRTAMPTTQPALAGLCMDFSQGLVLSVSAAGALTNAGPWSGAKISVSSYLNTAIAPDLRVTLD